MTNNHYPIVTAEEAISQGLTPSAFFSIAKFNERIGNFAVGQKARLLGREIASIMGIDIGGRRRRASNDNRRSNDKSERYGKTRNRRAA